MGFGDEMQEWSDERAGRLERKNGRRRHKTGAFNQYADQDPDVVKRHAEEGYANSRAIELSLK